MERRDAEGDERLGPEPHRGGAGLRERWALGLATWPNAFTLVRMALAPLFLLVRGDVARGVILALAALTEWLDGWIARRFAQTSRLGELLDPAADRLFMLAALAAFVLDGRLTVAQLALLLSRDIFTVLAGGAVLLLRPGVRLPARRPGKWVTALQLGTLVVLLLRPGWLPAALAVVVAVSVVAIVDYTAAGVRGLRAARAR